MFAEGTRSRDGSVGRLRAGAAVLAAQHGLPLVPIHVSGTHDVMPVGRYWMKRLPGTPLPQRHPIEIRFGAPIQTDGVEHRTEIMERVRAFFEQSDTETTPAERTSVLAGAGAP
jgi:1-acyl-sn-glycerol-3-phosphate acyltransferase